MKKSHGKNLVKIVLVASIGIFLSFTVAWAEPPAAESLNRDKKLRASIERIADSLRTRSSNFQAGQRFLSVPTRLVTPGTVRMNAVPRINSLTTQSRFHPTINPLATSLPRNAFSVSIRNTPALALAPSRRLTTTSLRATTANLGRSSLPRNSALPVNTGRTNIRPMALPPPRINQQPRISPIRPQTTRINPAPRMTVNNLAVPRIRNTTIGRTNLRPMTLQPARMNQQPRITNPPRVSVTANTGGINNRLNINNPLAVNRVTPVQRPATPKILERKPAQPFSAPRTNQLRSHRTPVIPKPVMLSLARSFNLSAINRVTANLPKNRQSDPIVPSQQSQPVGLPSTPVAPNATPNQATGGNGANAPSGSNSASGNHGAGSGLPLTAPLILGLCGHLPNKTRKTLSRIISEFSRRQKNGIGFMLAARSPNIIQMDECSLAFVHQMKREKNPTNSVHNKGLWSYYKWLRSQDDCGLFYFMVSKNGR